MATPHLLTPPHGSTLTLDVRADGLTIEAPRQPIRKASRGLFSFGLLWMGFCLLFTAVAALNPLFGIGESDVDWSDPRDVAMLVGIMLLFHAIGVGMIVASVNAARRRVIIDVVGDTLVVTRSSLFGTRQDEHIAADITHIERESTGTEINNKPVDALRIHTRDGKRLQLLTHLTNQEIDFVANLLRRALQVQPRP
ncbi:MAG: hypothetical protein AAF823_04430 [Planctomycetota bacterium]